MNIPKDEVQLVDGYINQFLYRIGGGGSYEPFRTKQKIDLKLALRALPFKMNKSNVQRIGMINFNCIKKSLIEF